MSGARLRVGVLGAGTVGSEVVRALLVRPDDLHASDGATLELTAVAVRDPARGVAAGVPAELLVTPALCVMSGALSGATS